MSQTILSNILNSKLSPEETIKWLTTDDLENPSWIDNNQSLTRAEFVVYFLNFLRDQFSSIQQVTNITNQTPSVKIIPQTSSLAGVVNTELHKIDNSGKSLHDFSRLNDLRPLEKNNSLSILKHTLSDENVNRTRKSVLGISLHSTSSSDERQNTKQVSENNSYDKLLGLDNKILEEQSSTENVNDAFIVTLNVQTSTPVIKEKISFNAQVSDPVKSFCITSPNNRNGNFVLTDSNRTVSSNNNSFPSIGKDQSSSLNASFLSPNFSQNECSGSSSHVSGNSIRSELHFSQSPLFPNKSQNPISPLYSHSMMMTAKNCQKLQNKSSERQLRINSNFHSTPEQTVNSSQKSAKSSSRHNLSLGDFMITDTRSSKKSSGKKNNKKMQLLRHSREDEIVSKSTQFLTEENFPEVGQSFESRKRIKPTKLDTSVNKGNKENTVFGTINRPVISNPQFSEVQSTDQTSDKTSFETERVLLRLERQKKVENVIVSKVGESDEPEKITRPTRKAVLTKSTVLPSLIMVDKVELLNILVKLYSAFIDNNLISNPMTEMYFILSLITTQYLQQNCLCNSAVKEPNFNTRYNLKSIELKNEDLESDLGCAVLIEEDNEVKEILSQSFEKNESDEKLQEVQNVQEIITKNKFITASKILQENSISDVTSNFKIDDLHLGTPHNCVYFSTRVLIKEKHLLKSLDRTTLKLLSENVHIAAFQPDLQDYLIKLYNFKLSEVNRSKQQYNFSTTDSNVCFETDTDNRENFPSAIAFQGFRKQRDIFYETLKIWEENHTNSNWRFSSALSGKIKSMLTLHSDLTNHSHLARLFKSQLLISCIRNGQQEDFIDDESLSILKSLKGVNPEKLTQLNERLVTPVSSHGPVPEPSFPGMQEFYKNFILCAFNPMFYAHLKDCFIHEIMELNDAQFAGSDIEDTETAVDERTKQNFFTCLSSLRLLAKFLSYLMSLPYRSGTSTLEEVINSQITLRSRTIPPLNLQACVKEAVIRGKLSLTIPWVVEFLSQLDIASLRLSYYTQLLEMLYCIYRICDSNTFVNSEPFMTQQTSVLIKFSLGWLFELSNFPTELYFSWQSGYTSRKLKMACEVENQNVDVSVTPDKKTISLDKLDIIDDRVLYSCCPFLVEFKILLASGNSQLNKSKSNRHITPVTSQLTNFADSINRKNLEFQLEEAFFHSQPSSTRKTIEFVSERVASTCVKYICNSLLPSTIEKSLNELRIATENKYDKNIDDNPNFLKSLIMKDINTLADNFSKQVKEQCENVIPSMCKERISQSIESLLAEDTLSLVKETCIEIANRMAMDRIMQWVQSHIAGGTLFMRHVESKINSLLKSDNFVTIGSVDNHNPNAACPREVLEDLRVCMWELLDNNGKSLTLQLMLKTLDQLYSCFVERADLLHGPENCLCRTSVDLSLLLVTYRKDLFSIDIQEKFVKFWKISLKRIPESESALSRLLSPRNVTILEKSNENEVWLKCGEFIKLLLKEEILNLESLSDQCIALLRLDWPTETLQNLSKCLNIAIEDYRVADEQAERIRYLLHWIADTYKDIDNFDE